MTKPDKKNMRKSDVFVAPEMRAAYAGRVFWFWFWWTMLALDGLWWGLAMRIVKRRLWRIVVSVFMAGQMLVLLSLLCEWGRGLYPKAVLVAIVVWHRIALPLALGLFVLLGIVRGFKAVRRRRVGAPDSDPARFDKPPTLAGSESGVSGAVAADKQGSKSLTRREFIGACATLAPPLFTVGLTAGALAQLNQFRVRRFTLSIPSLPRPLDGVTIAHVSDMHVGPWTCGRVLREMVDRTNALRPDLVLLTGDLIDHELSDLSEAIATVKAMEGRFGQWMIEGNHDLFDDGGEFERRVKAAGVPLLLDDSAVANVRGHPIQFFGLRWMESNRGRLMPTQIRLLMKRRQPEAFPILLAHHPHAFDSAVREGLPLTLAGHTHGGQWMLNRRYGVGPALFRYWSGLYSKGRSQLIVSNGVGNVFPVRINAPAEIVHITLRCGSSA